MYRVLTDNRECSLPTEALYVIRFHSFYPYHTSNTYKHLCDETDEEMLPWLVEFQSFDLYSKTDTLPDVEALKPYYQGLIDKYCRGMLKF